MDITSSSMHVVCMFARGVTSDFEVFQEVVELDSLQGKTRGSNFIQALQVVCSLQNIIWNWKIMSSVFL
jgi:hypothetical protein